MPWWAHILWSLIALGTWHHGYGLATRRANHPWVYDAETKHQAGLAYAEIVG